MSDTDSDQEMHSCSEQDSDYTDGEPEIYPSPKPEKYFNVSYDAIAIFLWSTFYFRQICTSMYMWEPH